MTNFTQGIVDYVKGFFGCLINVGVTEQVSADDRRYIRFANVVSVLTSLAIVAYVPSSLIERNYVLAFVQLIDLISVLSVLWLNHLGYHRIARQTYMLVVNVFVLINACVIGFESRVHDFFYFTYVLPFLLFRAKDYKNIVAGIIIAIVSFITYQHIYLHFTSYNLSLNDQIAVYQINVWMKFILFGIALYILALYNHTAQHELGLSNEKLEAQALELQRSNQDLEQFAYIISHDLKAPVRNISSFMKLLSVKYGNALPTDGREFVELSRTSADRLARQIDDLLSYCRVGRNLPPVATIDLNEMIKTIRMELGEKIREAKAEIVIDIDLPSLKQVHSSMIHHVFQNLVANGIKFNTHARPEVRIGYLEATDGFVFSISDNGIGIEPGFENKLFHMFKRLHTQEKFEGTGIGLAVCKKIVNFYKGEIWYESEPCKGTTFYFSLPKHLVGPPIARSSNMAAQPDLISKAA